MYYGNVLLWRLKKKEANFKTSNFTTMTAQQFQDRIDAITENMINKVTSETHFKHAIYDLLQEVVYNNEDLKKHYFKMYENEAKAWEYQSLVSH